MNCKLCGETMNKGNCTVTAGFAFHTSESIDLIVIHEHRQNWDECGASCNAFIDLSGCVFYGVDGEEIR